MPPSREGFTVRVLRGGFAGAAGVGFVAGERQIVTCAHVVNTALGRAQRAQDKPGPGVRLQVDFPLLGDADGGPSRTCRVEAWAPPPTYGVAGGDVAGLVLVGEGLPAGVAPARLVDAFDWRESGVDVFGYPANPPRHAHGAWMALYLRGAVGGGIIQLDADSRSAVVAQPGYSGSPAVVAGSGGDAVLGMLAVASLDEHARDAYAIPVSRLVEAWPDVLGERTIPRCPYKGLREFTADDGEAGLFVGRDQEIGQLRRMLDEHPLVVVTGPSGVGKSSLVNAGLIRAVRREGWIAEIFRPRGTPFDALGAALFRVERPGATAALDDLARWEARLRAGGLAALGDRLVTLRDAPVLLCADQLEQVLDPDTCDARVRARFLDLLLEMWAAPRDGLRLVCTLRADFLSPLLEHPRAGVRLRDRLFLLSPMQNEGLEAVIAEPAAARGVGYERGLVPLIARDAGEAGGLPLLEFTLTELWAHQRRRRISLAEYHDLGGVTGALSQYAERVYQELLGQFGEDQIRRVMVSLVRSRAGAWGETRRTMSRERLGSGWPVAEALARRRLLVLGHDSARAEDTAEIAHEALIRAWPRFGSWVDDDADFQHWLTALEERAAEGDLLSDARIAEADRWLAERADDIPRDVAGLIARSKAERHQRMAELAEARSRAETAARYAEARRLAAAAELALATRGVPPRVPVALAIESMRTAPMFEGDIAVRHAMTRAALQRSLPGHSGSVHAVVFSPDGSRVATGSEDGSARVFNAATGTELHHLHHERPVRAVNFSPDGSWIVTGSEDGSVRVFNAITGTELRRLSHNGPVRAVAFSADGIWVTTGTLDHQTRVFHAVTGMERARIDHDGPVHPVVSADGIWVTASTLDNQALVFVAVTGMERARIDHGGPVHAIVVSPDSSRVATGSEDGSARVWDAATGTVLRLLHEGPVRAVTFSPDGSRIATGSEDGSVRVFNAVTGAELRRLDHDGPVRAVAFSPDGTWVATGTLDHQARVFHAAIGAELCCLEHHHRVRAVAFSPDGSRVATGSADKSGRVFDATTGAELCRADYGSEVSAVAFSPDGSRMVFGSADGSAGVFDTTTNTELCRVHQRSAVWSVAFSPCGSKVATGGGDATARVYDAATGMCLSRVAHGDTVPAVAFSPDGTWVVTGSFDDTARVFDATTGKERWRIDIGSEVPAAAFSPDGSMVAIGCADDTARVLDAPTGTELCRLDHAGTVSAVVFSPDSSRVATGSADNSARVLDAATGTELCRLDHGGTVRAVAFSPDGSRVATGSADGGARVFDAVTGAVLCQLDHGNAVWSVAFSPDGNRVATGSDDYGARVWIISWDDLIQQARARLTSNLTHPEWRRYFPDQPYRKTRGDLP